MLLLRSFPYTLFTVTVHCFLFGTRGLCLHKPPTVFVYEQPHLCRLGPLGRLKDLKDRKDKRKAE
jgi:hypothetical protein